MLSGLHPNYGTTRKYDRSARNSFDFDERNLDLTAQSFCKLQQMEERKYSMLA